MTDHTNENNQAGQGGIDAETEQRNRENETGQQGQTGNETPTESTTGQSGFVGSDGDQSSDYLTKGENEDFQPEGQADTSAGTSDIETGQPTSQDSTLDDGADTSR